MAPLTDQDATRPTSRGQLLLTTGLGLAALIVVLALVLNTAIVTENYATRETGSVDTIDASRYEHAASTVIANALATENAVGHASYAAMHTNVTNRTAEWSELSARHHASSSRGVAVSLESTTNGTRIVQNDTTRTMTNVNNSGDWTLVDDATRVGRFTMTVDPLVAPTNTSNASDLHAAHVYTIIIDNGTTLREVFVFEGAEGDVEVRVANETGTITGGCTRNVSGGSATIDLVNASVENSSCPALADVDTLEGPSSIAYRDGANATGNYDIVVDRPAIDADLADYAVSGATDEPYGIRVVYDATISVRYVTPELTYEDTIRVSGGEWT